MSDAPRPSPTVRLRGLRKRFGPRVALAGVDLELAGPGLVGFVGPDGAGKTTLIRALAGLLEIEADEARVLGVDLRGDVRALKACIGYVPQAFSLQRELSVWENLAFTARLHQLGSAELARRARPLLEQTGLAPFTTRPAGALSGGMKQKLAVVNALLPEPALLLLDEPTAGVDVAARAEIGEILAVRRKTTLALLSTSYLEEAESCERLVYLDGGRVVAEGAPQELRERARTELYRAWSDDPRAVARAARTLPWVCGARASGRFARLEVALDRSPGRARVVEELEKLTAGGVRLVERRAVDMEAALRALARGRA